MKCDHPKNKGNECTYASCPRLDIIYDYDDIAKTCSYKRK